MCFELNVCVLCSVWNLCGMCFCVGCAFLWSLSVLSEVCVHFVLSLCVLFGVCVLYMCVFCVKCLYFEWSMSILCSVSAFCVECGFV